MMSEKNTLSFLRWVSRRTLFLPLKMDSQTWGDRYLARLRARRAAFSCSRLISLRAWARRRPCWCTKKAVMQI
ncbi:hypothetical protein D3C72_2162100 [compost metagenome]